MIEFGSDVCFLLPFLDNMPVSIFSLLVFRILYPRPISFNALGVYVFIDAVIIGLVDARLKGAL